MSLIIMKMAMLVFHCVCDRYASDYAHFTFSDII